MIDAMLLDIRQFFTYTELLERPDDAEPHLRFRDFERPRDTRQAYFDALELLRGHLSRCLGQIAVLAGVSAPADGLIAKYQGPWLIESYIAPPLIAPGNVI